MHFIFISLFIDMCFLIFRKNIKKKFFIKVYKSNLISLLLSIIILVYGFYNIINIVETRYIIYTDKKIENDLRILLISDSHYGDILNQDRLIKLKKKLDRVNADIVILGGDIVDETSTKEDMEYVFDIFGDIQNKYGVYFVYGNHDRQQYSLNSKYSNDQLQKTILNNNIKILKDNYIKLENNIVLVGRDDYSFNRAKVADILSDVDKDNYIIMIDHQPVNYDENIKNGVDLIMSGHTHGGQIFPIEQFIKIFHTADLSYGYRKIEGMDAIVSSGLVGWGYPIRTSRNSEYVVIDVQQQ